MFSFVHRSYFSPVKFSSTTQQFFPPPLQQNLSQLPPPYPPTHSTDWVDGGGQDGVGGCGEENHDVSDVVNDFSGRRNFFLQWSSFSCCLWQATKRCYGWQKRVEKKRKGEKRDFGENVKRSDRNWEKFVTTKRHQCKGIRNRNCNEN